MKTLFLRRFFIIFFVAFLLSIAVLIVGYLVLSRTAYIDNVVDDMLPDARYIANLTSHYYSGDLTYDAFSGLVDSAAGDASAIILKNDGKILYTNSDISSAELTRQLGDAIVSVCGGEIYTSENLTIDDNKVFTVGTPFTAETPLTPAEAEIDGGVLLVTPKTEVMDTVFRTDSALVLAVFAVLPIAAAISIISLRGLEKPVEQIISVTRKIGRGDFLTNANENAVGEFGELAREINLLARKLEKNIHDIDNEKQRLNQIIAGISDGVVAIDQFGIIMHHNSAVMKMFNSAGNSTREELIPYPEIWEWYDTVLSTKEIINQSFSKRDNDQSFWITVAPIYDEDEGVCIGAVGLFKDSTERDRTEKLRQEFISNVSHEFRTPLTGIRALVEMMYDDMVTDYDKVHRYYADIIRSVDRLANLVKDSLSLSQLQSGIVLKPHCIDVDDIIICVVDELTKPASEKNIILNYDSVLGEYYAYVDPDRIEQMITLFVDNALKYTQEGHVDIKVELAADIVPALLKTETAAKSNEEFDEQSCCANKYFISVTDTGCGIPIDSLSSIFERFYMVDKSHTPAKSGTGYGLGLSIAQQLTKAMGETVIVSSVLGKGSTFGFTVPIYDGQDITQDADEGATAVVKLSTPTVAFMPARTQLESDANADSKNGAIDADYEVIDRRDKK